MQNENPSVGPQPKKCFGLFVTGIILLVSGLVMLRQLWYAQANRWFPQQLELVLLFSPMVAFLGAVMLLVCLFRFFGLSARIQSARVVSQPVNARFEKAWRVFIWIVAISTIFPWWWMDLLVWSSGGRPGNEGEGMSGFLISIFFGLPALAVALHNEIRLRKNRGKQK
jgi:hypothetical protein